MPTIPHSIGPTLQAYAGPALAFAVALAGALVCRSKAGRAWLPMAGSAAALAGWILLLRPALHGALAPRAGPDVLLVPAAACALGVAVAAWRPGRIARWMPAVLAAFTGWWLASGAAGRAEFWRVWFGVTVLAWALARIVAAEPARAFAAALALWGGLWLLGGPVGWSSAALVAGAASGGLLAAGPGAALPAALLAALVAGADLGSGRLLRGALGGSDLACLGAVAAPILARAAAPRIGKRFGRLGPVVAVVGSAAVAAGAAWLVARALRH